MFLFVYEIEPLSVPRMAGVQFMEFFVVFKKFIQFVTAIVNVKCDFGYLHVNMDTI